MLQTQTVSPELLELLENIMSSNIFNGYNLVGGTALALQIGHRSSVDIDLFGKCDIEELLLISTMKNFGKVEVLKKSKNILVISVNSIKVDFVNFDYPLLNKVKIENGIRLVSKKDISAMKLSAITGRGSKKDFIDLCFLMNFFSLQEMMQFYLEKFQDGSKFLVTKSLTYFDDAEADQNPKMFKPFDWEKCKMKIIDKVKDIEL